MRCEVVAVGSELLLGQVVDTNSSWIGEQLALAGIDSYFQTKVGDNPARIVLALRTALARSDAVVVCGGLGPTQDDLTRECIAEVMNQPLDRRPDLVEHIRGLFSARGREMAPSNERQADVPRGAAVIHNPIGTAPGLIAPVGHKPIYAVPGVPYEMKRMVSETVLPDLQERAGTQAVILSRTLRTWGLAESTLAELVDARLVALDALAAAGEAAATIAFLASGMEGIKVRITAKAPTSQAAATVLDGEEAALRDLLGPLVFGVDDETMEYAVGELLVAKGWTLAVAESLTGGLVASRCVDVPGASRWFRGAVVAYATEVKVAMLGVPDGPVVSAAAAATMAAGVRDRLGADVGAALTGVAGPDEQDGQPVGTVFLGIALPGEEAETIGITLPGDRTRIRQFSCISLMNALRHRL